MLSGKLCFQDIFVKYNSKHKSDKFKSRILFNDGYQTTLVRISFAEFVLWSYSKASYSVACICSNAKVVKGKFWNVTHRDNLGNINKINDYYASSILKENQSFPEMMNCSKGFYQIP